MKSSLRGGNSFAFISHDINALEHSNQVNLPRVTVVMPLKGFGGHNLHNWRIQSSYKQIHVARHTPIEESIIAKSCPPPSQGREAFGGGGRGGDRGNGMRDRDGRDGGGRDSRGQGGGRGGMKGGSKVVAEPHRHEGVFIAKGKEDALCTKNMVPGEAVYSEKRISIQIDDVGMDAVMFLGQIDDVCMGAIYIIFLFIENMYT
ncbi:uncharacterized protein LOC114290974 [Camellia sinensis]|uniref:uncharacterized protein LOC114290974 n=1 Tax=Camellia sinensis TaxID=4442 RepID=UPI0010368C5F|nr:uncharacterized protein LOC114290974 [Camellia sinensis]